MKIRIFLGVVVVLAMICAISGMAVAKDGLFEGYNAVVVQASKVPSSVPAPASAGSQLAEAIVYQVRRYAQKYGLFDMVIQEGTAQVPAGKKVLLIKGEVREYTTPTLGGEIARSYTPWGHVAGSAFFAAHYQFIDKATGKVLDEQDLRTSSTDRNNTVDYAMQRNAEAAAKYIYKNK
ncbi:MAG: hypothetical protein MUO24_07680 [Desulfobacterales bacterium]|nr:hypothetical protein [Desulfobacterales bacterium]